MEREATSRSRRHDHQAAIRIADLEVRRGDKRVLPGIALEVRAGAVTGLLGPSGSGKSTLIRAIVGVQVVECGEVDVLGEPAGSSELRRRVAYVTQAPSVYTDLTVRENLRYFASIVDAPAEAIEDAIGHGRARCRDRPGDLDPLRRRALAGLALRRAARRSRAARPRRAHRRARSRAAAGPLAHLPRARRAG